MAYTAVPTSIAGDILTAAWQNTYIRDNLAWIAAAGISGWTAYTPTWTATGTAVALGNGVLDGRYRKMANSVELRMSLTMGSTTTYGTSEYRWALPVTAVAYAGGAIVLGSVVVLDSGTTRYTDMEVVFASTTLILVRRANTIIGQLVPHTWAVNDIIDIGISYEAA